MKFLFFVLALVASTPLFACDVCGCSIAGGGFGILSGSTQHFVGIGYTHLRYNNDVAPVEDHFNRIQLTGQIQLKRRWRVQAVVKAGLVPSLGFEYAHISPNTRRETGTELHGSGGNSFNLSGGIQAERNNYAIGLETAIPLSQTFGNGDALATPRFLLLQVLLKYSLTTFLAMVPISATSH